VTEAVILVDIRVLVADSTRMNTELVADALRRDSQFDIFASLVGAPDLPQSLAEFRPDVVVVGISATDGSQNCLERMRDLRQLAPSSKFVVLIDSHTPESVVEVFRAGARGIFSRSNSVQGLCKCIQRVHEGHIWASHEEMAILLDALAAARPARMTANGIALLSPREKEVVRFVAEGMTNREIGKQLQLSENTVKNYLFRIFDKLGVSNRAELIFMVFSSPPASLDRPIQGPPQLAEQVPKEESAAFEWCHRTIERLAQAQVLFAEMYRKGRGTQQDAAEVYFWSLIAELSAQRRIQISRKARLRVGNKLNSVEIAEVEHRAAEWIEAQQRRSSPPITTLPRATKEIA
jgi:two-component system nitrate/nitrite response regulator NarL